MPEKLAEVYEKYDIEIISSRRGRGANILTTTDGLYILEPFRGNVARLEQEYVLKGLFEEEGFHDFDLFVLNKTGELLTNDRYHQPFVLKKHFEGEECDMRNLADVVRAIEKLAQFHLYGKRVVHQFQDAWEKTKWEKEQQQIKEMKQMHEDGEELEQIARIYGFSLAVVREMIKEKPQGQEGRNVTEKDVGKAENNTGDVLNTFVRRNRELRKIRKFVGGVKRKNSFENLFLQVFSEYYNKGIKCQEIYSDVDILKNQFENHYGICHGNYNQHNIIMDTNNEAIVHFEHFSKGNQLGDVYQFARKAMEKNHFDYEMLDVILDAYSKHIKLSQDDYQYIYVLFSYPEKFWKIANNYYNTNKAFLSPKYIEKLQMVLEQEKEKNEMLSSYYAFHLN